jgi:hypothetical protein
MRNGFALKATDTHMLPKPGAGLPDHGTCPMRVVLTSVFLRWPLSDRLTPR